MPRTLNHPSSTRMLTLLSLVAALSATPAAAQPEGTGTLGDALSAAGMTFTIEEADELTNYNAKAPNGYTFKLSQVEEGYSVLPELGEHVTPRGGTWGVGFHPGTVRCPDSPSMEGILPQILANLQRSIFIMAGSPDRGDSLLYEFSEPFSLAQVLDPIGEILSMADQDVEINYSPAVGNLHSFQGWFGDGRDRTQFKGEIATISEDYMMGFVIARNDTCTVEGLLQFIRRAE